MQQAGGNQAAVAYILTGIAFATFIGIILYHLYFQTKESEFWKVVCCRRDDQQEYDDGNVQVNPETDSGDRPLVPPSVTYVSYGAGGFREPLLDAQ